MLSQHVLLGRCSVAARGEELKGVPIEFGPVDGMTPSMCLLNVVVIFVWWLRVLFNINY